MQIMNKKVMSKVIFIILIVILIISIIFAIANNKKNLSKAMYKKICEKSIYTFSMEEISNQIDRMIVKQYYGMDERI